jgi:hypothetical protein
MAKQVKQKAPKTDAQGRIICRTALVEEQYMHLLAIKAEHKRSVAFLLREGAEEVIKKYKAK